MPTASEISIKINGVDITNKVLYASARFEAQLGAIPGTADLTVKDVDQTFSAVTGDDLTLDLDGVRMWGGIIRDVSRVFALPVVDTTTPGSVTARQFRIQALDYNCLFDGRVIHNDLAPLDHLPFFPLDTTIGELVRDTLPGFLDDVDDIDFTTFVDDGFVPRFDANGNPDPDGTKNGSWPQQGTKWREVMETFAQFGFVYYIDASKKLHLHEVEDTAAPWGFSDVPNKLPLPNAAATYGMREYEDTKSGAAMVNDALVWGGSEWSGSAGGTVFGRHQNTTSISVHGRWQTAEVKFGELKDQGMVQARANVIASGNTTGAVGGDTSRGLAVEQKQIRLAWFGHDVPLLSGTKAHLQPGMVVTTSMYVLSEDGGLNPSVLVLPLRSLRITFPTIPPTGSAEEPLTYVRFDGFFGLQLSDPWWLWKYLRDLVPAISRPPVVATADGSTTVTVHGALGQFEPTPEPDGAETVFTIPFAYIERTTEVYRGSPGTLALQIRDVDYTESDPALGEITFTSPPAGTDQLWVNCRVAGPI